MRNDLEAARTAFEQGDVALSLHLVYDHLRREKHDGRAWELLGLLQYTRKRISAAIKAFEQATMLVPLYPATRVCLAICYGQIGKRELSKDLLTALIDDESLTVPLVLQVAAGLDAIDQPGLSMRACREASRREPEHPQPYYDLGYYAARCGQPTHVSENLARKAISLDPGNVCYRVGLASLLIKQDRKEEGYQVVAGLSNQQIQNIGCRCCLERIAELFESAGDYRRVVLCRQHLLSLEIRESESDCQ